MRVDNKWIKLMSLVNWKGYTDWSERLDKESNPELIEFQSWLKLNIPFIRAQNTDGVISAMRQYYFPAQNAKSFNGGDYRYKLVQIGDAALATLYQGVCLNGKS